MAALVSEPPLFSLGFCMCVVSYFPVGSIVAWLQCGCVDFCVCLCQLNRVFLLCHLLKSRSILIVFIFSCSYYITDRQRKKENTSEKSVSIFGCLFWIEWWFHSLFMSIGTLNCFDYYILRLRKPNIDYSFSSISEHRTWKPKGAPHLLPFKIWRNV